ncbi:MAG TPA: hypothetical protein VHF25_17410 [Nitriliruptorales bacterium]|nr:hypothetical protein [Nitriliruptorales bacterium]
MTVARAPGEPPAVEELTRAELPAVVAARDVSLPTFSDEELAVVCADPGALQADARLAGLSQEARETALRTALRSLVARGYVGPPPVHTPGRTTRKATVHGALALVVELRRRPAAVARVGREPDDGRERLLHVVEDRRVVLVEAVAGGYHAFVLRGMERAVAWLAGLADPEGHARCDGDPVVRRGGRHPPGWERVEAAAAGATSVTRLDVLHLRDPDRGARAQLSVAAGPQGVWAVSGSRADDGSDEVAAMPVSRATLAWLLHRCLVPEPDR